MEFHSVSGMRAFQPAGQTAFDAGGIGYLDFGSRNLPRSRAEWEENAAIFPAIRVPHLTLVFDHTLKLRSPDSEQSSKLREQNVHAGHSSSCSP